MELFCINQEVLAFSLFKYQVVVSYVFSSIFLEKINAKKIDIWSEYIILQLFWIAITNVAFGEFGTTLLRSY